MSRRLLDTNIWIALANGEREPKSRLQQFRPSEIVTCSMVRAELAYGARRSARTQQNIEGYGRLLQPFESLRFDDLAADHYGLIRADLERMGKPVSANDLLIAATARAHDCILVTRNGGEFGRVPGLRVEAW